jgi:inner membrane protein involved in colicin E2 resistance
MGSLLLFAVLSAIMLGTRRFDWYALTAKAEPPKTFSFEEAKE